MLFNRFFFIVLNFGPWRSVQKETDLLQYIFKKVFSDLLIKNKHNSIRTLI